MSVRAVEVPLLWMPYALRVNPHLSALHQESESWARSMGMLGGHQDPSNRPAIWTHAAFRAMTVDQLTAWTLPDASLADLRLNHRFNIWALAWDDHFASAFKRTDDLAGAHSFTLRLHAFLGPERGARAPEPANAVERGLADLQQQLFPPRLAHWRTEFNRALARYIDAGVEELANSRSGRIPHLIDYAPFRRESFAAYTAPYSVELATGARIPEQIRHTRTVRALLDAFMDFMGLANDIASYEREVHEEKDVNNLVLVVGTSLGISLRDAVPAALNLVNARLRDFEHLRRSELPPLVHRSGLDRDERAELETWLRGACGFLSGLHAWYTGAPRYASGDASFPE
ncbi:terpene synthase family protein [Streptomyces sp. SP18ES09]|uniref:terpene synthase family protein n=1 Tax=Streptomyces sp. SP18ES09 TaxID=3002532 RepID=UPI002E75B538|nr:terpene synthase family protein [Streptomyces sp. SP18ES09]MEE1815999.1 terpene synthase family protein [Streptomyces sp. SP18ES09]